MTRFGYHVSHEQYAPAELLALVQEAEAAGFACALSSDHLAPWLPENGHSGYAWSWLGAALQATTIPYRIVCAPGDRYHPVVIAQAAATLAGMFPGRFWLAVGSGEALNEHVTGAPWPRKPERNARLLECVEIIRALWRGETVNHRGRVTVEDARVWSLPTTPPALFGAAVSEATAEWVGGWADGLITTGRPREEMVRVIAAFRRGGGAGKRVLVQHGLSWHPDEEVALRAAHEQWRFTALEDPDASWNLRTPDEFARATRDVTPDDVGRRLRVSARLEEHARWLQDYVALGVDEVYCFNVGRNQREYIAAFGREVLPALRGATGP